MIFLRAAPELYPELSRYEHLLGSTDSLVTLQVLDSAAQKHRYSSYAEFAVVYNRITNAATYARMLEKNVDLATIGDGEGPQGVLIDDAQLVFPYLDDVERVVSEAKVGGRPQGDN